MRNLTIANTGICSLLVSCTPASLTSDPVRAEFVEACQTMKAYRSMAPLKRTEICECTYDKTMSGLSEGEKQAARFYLFTQAGVDVKSRGFVTSSNLNDAPQASQAIGKAVRRCS